MISYADFLERKSQLDGHHGFEPNRVPDFLFDFQRELVGWAVRKGRAAIFADCGMGKTPMQLAWADAVVRHTNRPVLVLTPLAVGAQTVKEAAKFGIEAQRSGDGTPHRGITITNYERLEKFSPDDYAGVVCDESSILKGFDGATKQRITDFARKMRYRLLCTATAAPNDYIELGTSSEALGYLGHMDMLGRFFRNDQNTSQAVRQWSGSQWRFKGHARANFWRWVSSWARALRRPSDFGFSDKQFILPPLVEREHLVEARTRAPGKLFDLPASGLWEEREEARRTLSERCERVAELVSDDSCAVVWCHLNAEGDLLEEIIDGSVQISGSDSPEVKEERFAAFADGKVRVLVIKPKIGAWGLNWQHCAHMTFFPSHSFEQYYQAVRRCWRFGQKRPVVVDIVTTESGKGVMENLQRKSRQCDEMFTELVAHMNDALHLRRTEEASASVVVPSWIQGA